MFRLHESALPADFYFPADLERLGYYITDEDQVRSIKHPDQEFNFFISKNERMNVVHREAFNSLSMEPQSPSYTVRLTHDPAHIACVRQNIQSRLLSTKLDLTLLPLGATAADPHVQIYTSTNISTCTRLVVYVGESWQDLGVLAYRTISQESIASGSVIDLVRSVQECPDNPGIIIANTGQLLWYRGGHRAVTQTTWAALPRQTAVSPQMEIDEVKNRVPGCKNATEHVAYIFDEVIPKMAMEDVKIDVIGMGDGAPEVVGYLRAKWERWEKNVQAVALGTGFVWTVDEVGGNAKFRAFWSDCMEPLAMPLVGRNDFGCNCYSAGEGEILECIMPKAYKSILKFFRLVNDVPGYRELAGFGEGALVEEEGTDEEVEF
ncbi:MAG: hypothetical protein LQ348_000586 [Seirophora lacunosa]|nr:MAG: hypothetical protein LQ344_006361 [Seirophora lacunosa]KAI4207400.1 MAG: hypothetical protein LQ348_000586 [Seirophora lacunosa]